MGFQQGLSGLSASSTDLDIVGNNIANASTVGFKSSSSQFADVYATSLYGAGGLQIGIGTKVAAVGQKFTQGNISVTNNPLDVAISGEGFFGMTQGGVISYARNGQFNLDKNGYIVNNSAQQLMGYIADSTGAINGGIPVPIQISLAPAPPNATTLGTIDLNLDSQQTAIAATFDPLVSTTYNHSTSLTVYDSGGNAQGLVLYFQKTGTNAWNAYGYVNGKPIDMSGAGTTLGVGDAPIPMALTFSTNGILTSPAGLQNIVIPGVATPANPVDVLGTGAGNLDMKLDFSNFTQYGSSFGVSSVNQDGFASGRIAGVSVAKDGIIQGRYTNGQTRTLGQVALNSFLNPNGLQALGNNQWFSTAASGQPTVGSPGSGTLGYIQSGAVEESNVDMTAELVKLIVAQRAYQANAQSISAQSQILQTLVNLR